MMKDKKDKMKKKEREKEKKYKMEKKEREKENFIRQKVL